jgi:hypothetical protein
MCFSLHVILCHRLCDLDCSLVCCCLAAGFAAEFVPATAEPSLVGLGQQPSSLALSPATPSAAAAAGDDTVSLQTFRSLLDKLMQQKSDIESLLPAADVDIVRINAAALKQALIPWPVNRLAELHKALPVLAAGTLLSAVSKTQTKCTGEATLPSFAYAALLQQRDSMYTAIRSAVKISWATEPA